MPDTNCFNRLEPLKNAKWITADKEIASPKLLRRFKCVEVKKARLFITGLGYFEAQINGQCVTDKKFIPILSNYEKRELSLLRDPIHDTLTSRIYYYEFDITDLLSDGDNILSVQLGNGFYRENERIDEGKNDFSNILKARYALLLENGTTETVLYSDGSETYKNSEIVYSNMFTGEIIDPNKADNAEKCVSVLPDNDSALSYADGSDDRIISEITPRLIAQINGKKIYDAEINISGIVRVKTHAVKGHKITLRFAENLNPDNTLNTFSTGSHHSLSDGKPQVMSDTFICDGTERYFEPKFVWHAFRYFEVCGDIDEVSVLVIHSDVPVTSSFESSFEGLNFLYDAFIRTQLNNMHGCIPMDCPHRERLGYTGDGQVCSEAGMLLLGSKDFYRKWIRDIFDSQCSLSGHIQHTAPLMGGGGGPGGWGCAAIIVPYNFYKIFGDTEILSEYYDRMLLWLDYLMRHSENGLVVREEKNGWCLGDWCTLNKTAIPESYVNTCYHIKSLELMCEIAEVIGKSEDTDFFKAKRELAIHAVYRNFFDCKTSSFCGGIQGADAYAVWCGIAGADTSAKIYEKYDSLGHFDTGFLGTNILTDTLFSLGFTDTAYKLLESEELGSFLYMKRRGATTLWENWSGGNSHDHPMFGACARQLFRSVLGIKNAEYSCGFSSVIINPSIPSCDGFAKGSIETPQGRISVEWNKCGEKTDFDITLSKGIKAVFSYNGKELSLTGKNRFSI